MPTRLLLDEIERLNTRIEELESELDHWPLKLYDALESIDGRYSMLLHPPAHQIPGSHAGRSEIFKVTVSEIVAIKSINRIKRFYLKTPSKSLTSSYSIDVNQNKDWGMDSIKNRFDAPNVFLVNISKSLIVNSANYSIDIKGDAILLREELKLRLKDVDLHRICVNKNVANAFIKQIEYRDSINETYENVIRYKKQ